MARYHGCMNAWTDSEIAAGVAVLLGFLQVLAAPWRDLGIVSLAGVGASLVLARGEPTIVAAALLIGAGLLMAWAWNRGSRRGVGRPGLDGVGVAVAVVAGLWPFVLPDTVPPGPREHGVELALVALGLTASVGLALALERPGPRRLRPRFFRRVEVVEQRPEARGEASPGEEEAGDDATAPDAA